MINPDSIETLDSYYPEGKSETVEIKELPYFDSMQYDLSDEKDYNKFIQDTERLVRNSYEYRKLIEYLRNIVGMDKCTFLENVTNLDNTKIGIEIHHTPLTLFDIASTVINKRVQNKESVDIFDVSEEIMYLHYIGFVGLVPLSVTAHELVHNNYLFVPTNIVRGNYKEFINRYNNWIDGSILEYLNSAEEITNDYLLNPNNEENIINKQMRLFNKFSTYISIGNIEPITNELSVLKEYLYLQINKIRNKKVDLFK